MRDWKTIAQASGLPLPAAEIDRIAGPLSALDEAFQPLVRDLSPGLEPDPELHLDGVDE